MSVFSSIPNAPSDPIFGLTESFQKDTRMQKSHLGIGVYANEHLQNVVLKSVKEAEARLQQNEASKNYLPIEGHAGFLQKTAELVFGDQVNAVEWIGVQTLGGQGALRLIGELLAGHKLANAIYLPDPSWPNHAPTFQRCGLQTPLYPYYDKKSGRLEMEKMETFFKNLPEKSAVLFHGCCHNPTGADFNEKEWQQVISLLEKGRHLPIIDIAYQGFGKSLSEDAYATRFLLRRCPAVCIAYSFSKNMGLYAERTGALFIKGAPSGELQSVLSQLKRFIRTNYSNPPCHGAKIAWHILSDPELAKQWMDELQQMAQRLRLMRKELAIRLQKAPIDVAYLQNQTGMFSILPLSGQAVVDLVEKYTIYLPSSGRINVGGLSLDNLDRVAEALLGVEWM